MDGVRLVVVASSRFVRIEAGDPHGVIHTVGDWNSATRFSSSWDPEIHPLQTTSHSNLPLGVQTVFTLEQNIVLQN